MKKKQYNIILKSYNIQILDLFIKDLIKFLKNYGCVSLVHLPKKTQRFTVLKSPHVNKESREQFEIKIKRRLIVFKITESHAGFWFKYFIKKFDKIFFIWLAQEIPASVELKLKSRF
jgi:small subunit ribosomal protein S10